MRLGASFSPRRARGAGLDTGTAFRRLLDEGLSPLRLSTYWDEVDEAGYDELDGLIAAADRAGRDVVLTVGMKAQGWPEFAIPERLVPAARRGSDITAASPALRAAVLELVETTIIRYRGAGAVVAWQVENEPLNRSGPRRWWIGPDLLREQQAVARRADPSRPLLLNVFARYNLWLDVASNRHGLGSLLGGEASRPEAEALALLEPGDALGLDVYRSIGYRRFGQTRYTISRHWLTNAAAWLGRAAAERKQAWIVEAQAEPWEPGGSTTEPPASCRPPDVIETVQALGDAGYDTVLLWGAEHWLAADARGDGSWLEAVQQLLDE